MRLFNKQILRLTFSQTRSNCRSHSGKVLDTLRKRQLLTDLVPDRPEVIKLLSKPQCVYAGFDPTADGLHFGNLLVLMSLLHMLRNGHRVICLIGDATACIGDPSDKKGERPQLQPDTILANSSAVAGDISRIFANHRKYFWKAETNKFDELEDPIILHNNDWYRKKNVIDFVGQVGRRLRMTDMLSRKFVADRVKSREGLSFTEFSYQVFQGYDWLHLFNTYDCRFQVGASDQIGNFHSGIHLIRRFKDQQVYGMALPLIVDEEGNKYGKSLGNPVWLSPSKRPAFEFYQFFLRLPDIHVEQFLRQFTFLKEDQIESTMQKKLRSKDPYVAHRLLAEQITLLVHGSDALRVAQLATQILYEKSVDAVAQLTHRDLERIFDASQVTELMLEPGETTVLDLAIKSKAFVHSIDAVRTIQQGAFSINQVKVTDPSRTIDNSHILPNLTTLLKIGKKRFYLIKWK